MSAPSTVAAAKRYLRDRTTAAHALLNLDALTELTDAALDAVERCLTGYDEGNCSWAIYAVRDVLLREVRGERQRRAYLRELSSEPVEVVS